MISCEQFDYIELVCLFQYPVQLEMMDGALVQGIAKDTKRSEKGEECIELEVDGQPQLLVLEQVKKLVVQVSNPHLQEISFRSS